VDDAETRAIGKTAPDQFPDLVYALAMERIAFRVGTELGLNVPTTWLETVDGKPGSVQRLVPNALSWEFAWGSPLMMRVLDEELWPVGVAFDVWIANQDRASRNLMAQAFPSDQPRATARECVTWWIDNGDRAGLLFPAKFGLAGGRVEDVDISDSGLMQAEAEADMRDAMPTPYRNSFERLDGPGRAAVLDRVRSIPKNLIEDVVGEVPGAYMSDRAAASTVALLVGRQRALDTLSDSLFDPR
jgi:hypothetical protein